MSGMGTHQVQDELVTRLRKRCRRLEDENAALRERVAAALTQVMGDEWLWSREHIAGTLRGDVRNDF